MRIGSAIISYLSKLWKAKFFILCGVMFLVRLQGNWNWSLLGVKGLMWVALFRLILGLFIPGFPKLLRLQDHHDKILKKLLSRLYKHLVRDFNHLPENPCEVDHYSDIAEHWHTWRGPKSIASTRARNCYPGRVTKYQLHVVSPPKPCQLRIYQFFVKCLPDHGPLLDSCVGDGGMPHKSVHPQVVYAVLPGQSESSPPPQSSSPPWSSSWSSSSSLTLIAVIIIIIITTIVVVVLSSLSSPSSSLSSSPPPPSSSSPSPSPPQSPSASLSSSRSSFKQSTFSCLSGSVHADPASVGYFHVGRRPPADSHGLQHHEDAQK